MFRELNPDSVIIIIPKNQQTLLTIYKNQPSHLKNIEKIVVKIGAANEILTTVANGKFLNAIKIAIRAISPNIHLKKCKPALFV